MGYPAWMRTTGEIRDPVTQAVLEVFKRRFVPRGCVLWASDGGEKSAFASRDAIAALRLRSGSRRKFPNVVIYDAQRRWLFLMDVARIRGRMTTKRCQVLTRVFRVG